jgi:hypothetical protein
MTTTADIRKIQRLAKALDKRILAEQDSTELAIREAANYANACEGNRPIANASEAMVDVWKRDWMAAYNRQFEQTLSAATGKRR